ncbi:hypothetical protein [Consotaella aegiceratis]|uniref:hypothetical protein n=1 Tax=Consotaella aegiceratis TaxID=3097961 RepID=UPI002F3F8E05
MPGYDAATAAADNLIISEGITTLKPWLSGEVLVDADDTVSITLSTPGLYFALAWFRDALPSDAEIANDGATTLYYPEITQDAGGPSIWPTADKSKFKIYNPIENYDLYVKYIIFHNRAD